VRRPLRIIFPDSCSMLFRSVPWARHVQAGLSGCGQGGKTGP
jgi:hypothetical protein